jgi:hypothetical protein
MQLHVRCHQVGLAGNSSSNCSSFVVLELPPKLTGLTLLCKTPDPNSNERQTLRFMHGALPSSLVSLHVGGMACSVQMPLEDISENAAGWKVGEGRSHGVQDSAGAAVAAAAAGRGEGDSSSSSGKEGNAENSRSSQALTALPLLQHASVVVDALDDAADIFRWVTLLRGIIARDCGCFWEAEMLNYSHCISLKLLVSRLTLA